VCETGTHESFCILFEILDIFVKDIAMTFLHIRNCQDIYKPRAAQREMGMKPGLANK
jgi:hypothetical protein